MKSLVTFIWVLCSLGCFAQLEARYDIDISERAFVPLSGGQQLLPAGWKDFEGRRVSLPFTFPFLDSSFTSVRYEATGRLVFDNAHYYYADAFSIANLEDGMLTGRDSSHVTYHARESNGVSQFIIQVDKARLSLSPHKQVSFQIVLNEEGAIAYRSGPRDSIQPSDISLGPYTGVYHLAGFSPVDFFYGQNWLSSRTSSDTLFSGIERAYLSFATSYLPKEGRQILISPLSDSLETTIEELSEKEKCPTTLSIVFNGEKSNDPISVYALDGQLVLKARTIDAFNELPTGIYTILATPNCPIKYFKR